ncbi:MAG: MG2 domain-containing protein [Woeseiaceae bacterium]
MQFIKKALFYFFGTFTWQLPPWLKVISQLYNKALNGVKNNKGTVWLTILFTVIGLVGMQWYDSLPKPVQVQITGTAPSLTELKEDPTFDSVYINFSSSAAPLEQIGKLVSKGISISPAINGKWTWRSDSQLQFTPEQDWAVGEEYTVKFKESFFPDHLVLSTYEYRFVSTAFSAQLMSTSFHQDPIDPKIKRIVATVKFTHPIDKASFEDNIKMNMQNKKQGILSSGSSIKFEVTYNKFDGEAYLKSEPIDIPLKNKTIKIEIEGGYKSSRGGYSWEEDLISHVNVPGMYSYFRVSRVNPTLVRNKRNEPEQVLIVETTAGVKEKELQKNITVYELPKHLPAILGRKARRNYRYWRADDVGPEVLRYAKELELKAIPNEHEFSTMHSFKYKSAVGRSLYIKVNKGTKSFGGYILADAFENVKRVPQFPRELKIMHEGAILGMRGERKLSVVSRGIKSVQFEVGRVLPGQISHLVSQSNGDFLSHYFSNYNFNADNITDRFTQTRNLKATGPEKAQYTAFDFSPYLNIEGAGKKRGLFFFKVQRWDERNKRATGALDKRLILVTDLGLLVKDNADRTHDVFVQSLSTGHPVANAKVEILGKNGVAVYKVLTNIRGRASFPSFNDLKREKQPVAYLVTKGQDVSFIPYNKGNRKLNFSRFDTGGIYQQGKELKLNAYLFSDRGIYRPGDKFNVAMIIRSSDWDKELEGLPMEVVINDARGLTVKRQKLKLDGSGFEEVSYQTEYTSPTGDYSINAYLIKDKYRRNLLGSTTVRVEEFIPDRMKIQTRFSKERLSGWVSPEGLQGRVSLQNLYGIPAPNRRIAASINLNPARPYFRKYKAFRFYDPLRAKHSFSEHLNDSKTDDEGIAVFDIDLSRFAKATYRLSLITQGYEAEGGRGVSAERSVLISPLAYLVGYKTDGKLNYIHKDSERTVDLLAVSPDLDKMDVSGLQMELIEQRHVSVLTKQNNGTYKYQSVKKKVSLKRNALKISKTGTKYTLPTDKAGDFTLVIRDGNDTELNKISFSVVGDANLARSLDKNAELQIKLNKTDFNPGDEIELQIKAPYVGAGLITIERDRVYAYKWFKTTTSSSVQRITVPYDLEGNGYVNVSFIRAPDSKEIFMSPLSYGVMPFTVNRSARVNKVTLNTPDIARPGEDLKIQYETERAGKIVVFAVNEGILQVAGYKTPDPLSHFFKKKALEVSTSQILDLLLPEFDLVKALSAPGGGAMEMAALGKNLNPFQRKQKKPVVFWSGIIETDGSKGEVVYSVPDHFNGKLRIMAVAVADQAIGVAKNNTLVRGHFIISPNVPTFVAPGDEFSVSVNVANNLEKSGENAPVTVRLETSKHLEVLTEATQKLTISEGREQSTIYKIKANDVLGSGRFTFVVSHASKKGIKTSRYRVDLSVRPAVPFMTKVTGGYLQDDNVDVPVDRNMYPQFRKLEVSASPVPLGMARGLVHYLGNYPYMCTEQLVSRSFPAIVLRDRPEFSYKTKDVEKSLSQIIRILRGRQNSEGAFGFWSANSHVSNYQSVYALHFLTEARERGYPVPADLLQRGLSFLKQLASRQINSLSQARDRAYAIYILTRNGIVTTRMLDGLRKELAEEMKPENWEKDLTGIYIAATYKMLRLESEAIKIIKKSKLGDTQQTDYQYFYDGLLRDANLLYILSYHFKDRLEDIKADELESLVKPILRGNFNTLSSASVILALDTYATATGTPKEMKLKIQEVLASKEKRELGIPPGLFPQIPFTEEAKAIHIDSEDDHNLFYQVTEAGFDKALPVKDIKQQLEVQREYRNAKGDVIDTVTLGEEVHVYLKVRALDNKHHYNIAVVDLLPGGFEVVLDKSLSENQSGWKPQYVDSREDRMIVFGDVGSSVQEFVYRIKAINVGDYKVPPTFGESMYDRGVVARSLGGKISVTKP